MFQTKDFGKESFLHSSDDTYSQDLGIMSQD